MARVLIQYWTDLVRTDFVSEWEHFLQFRITGTDAGEDFGNTVDSVSVMINSADSAAQIRTTASNVIRAKALSDYNATIDNNQIIWPDGTRS